MSPTEPYSILPETSLPVFSNSSPKRDTDCIGFLVLMAIEWRSFGRLNSWNQLRYLANPPTVLGYSFQLSMVASAGKDVSVKSLPLPSILVQSLGPSLSLSTLELQLCDYYRSSKYA